MCVEKNYFDSQYLRFTISRYRDCEYSVPLTPRLFLLVESDAISNRPTIKLNFRKHTCVVCDRVGEQKNKRCHTMRHYWTRVGVRAPRREPQLLLWGSPGNLSPRQYRMLHLCHVDHCCVTKRSKTVQNTTTILLHVHNSDTVCINNIPHAVVAQHCINGA